MNKMSPISRIILAIASLSLIGSYFLPVWFIFLIAPQYPEGLTMNIWLTHLSGQVDIINGLNHYIGMKHIKAEMFPEFGYLIYAIGALIILGLLVAVIGKRKFLLAYILLLIVGAIAAMADFYKWGYDYGHNLDPKAAIQVPGLYYQPPLIGHKTLLNFDAYSYPDIGGWIIIGAGVLFILVWVWEGYRIKKMHSSKALSTALASLFIAFSLSSCSVQPEPFQYGKDACSFCKMNITDPHFGGEVLTKKGRVYKFDDIHCLLAFLRSGEVKESATKQTLIVNYLKENDLIDVTNAQFIQGGTLHSPMNGNVAAFQKSQDINSMTKQIGGTSTTWQQLLNTVN